MSTLTLRGWAGPGEARIDVTVDAGACAQILVADPPALLRRAAGFDAPALWLRLDGRDIGRLPPLRRARAGLATVTGVLPPAAELTVLDLLLLGRPLPGWFGLRGLARDGTPAAAEREASARALAGRLGLSRLLDEPLTALDMRQAAIADLARALMAEPRALLARCPSDVEAARWFTQRLAEEAAARRCAALVLGTNAPPGMGPGATLPPR